MATPQPIAEALRFDKPLHGLMLNWLRSLGNRAAMANEEKHDAWNRVEQMNRLYADPDEVDDKGNLKNPYDNLLVIPWGRVSRDAFLTSLWLPWAERDPFMPLSGREPGDIVAAQLMAARCQYDVDMSQLPLKMYAWFGNAVDFGIGAMTNYWVRDHRAAVRYDRGGNRRVLTEHYEGNYPALIDPYRLLTDPDVPAGRHQDGSIFGYSTDISYASAMRLARQTNERGDGWFNVDQIKDNRWTAADPFLFGSNNASVRNRVQGLSDPGDSAVFGPGAAVEGSFKDGKVLRYHILTCLEVVASPADLIAIAEAGGVSGFGEALSRAQPPDPESGRELDRDDLQFWKFELFDGRVIVNMEPMAATQFSGHIIETDPDLLSRYVPGRVELSLPLSGQINRIINQHNANVDRGVYGVTIIDDEAINLADFRQAITGGIVRKNPEWSGDVRTAAMPLPWQDATRANLADIPMYQDLIMRLMRTSDQGMGQVSQGRRAAYDVAAATGGANAGARTTVKLMSYQGINSLLRSFVKNIQLYDTQERWVRITGALAETLAGSRGALPPPLDKMGTDRLSMGASGQPEWALVDWKDLQGNFDIAVLDGRPSGPDVQRAQAYLQAMQQIGQIGGFQPKQGGAPPDYDPKWFIKRFAEEMGIKNLRDAELMPRPGQAPMMPPERQQGIDEAILQQAQAGNLAPVNEGGGEYA